MAPTRSSPTTPLFSLTPAPYDAPTHARTAPPYTFRALLLILLITTLLLLLLMLLLLILFLTLLQPFLLLIFLHKLLFLLFLRLSETLKSYSVNAL